jgi:GntR family transcriptional regulator
MSDVAIRPNGTSDGVDVSIDRSTPIPYYYQLEVLLRQQIANGRWKVGQRIPSEKQFCEQYAVSRTTVRQAVNDLVALGLLYHVKGKGTFVARRTPSENESG